MFRRLLLMTILFLFFLIAPVSIGAQEDFGVDADVSYVFDVDGYAVVTHSITLTNKKSERRAQSYSLTLTDIDPSGVVAYEGDKVLDSDVFEGDGLKVIKTYFDEPVLGKGGSREFSIVYSYDGFAEHAGEVWEVSIPKLADTDSFDRYSVSVEVPSSFGSKAYMSPEPNALNEVSEHNTYYFDKDDIAGGGVTAGFGEIQVFSFSLKYHLENPLMKSSVTSIAIPADTQFQRMKYKFIEPLPESFSVDEDGNWIAEYMLGPRQKLDVTVVGDAHIFASPIREFVEQDLQKYLQPVEYWESDASNIIFLARTLGTPSAIYNYVVNSLSYDTDRVKPNVQRLGAVGALANPDSATCMEFTDLFIALSRAAGIPAREINGYAHTENPDLEPLSLVADVLHSWPEYWDQDLGYWIPVDPTWGNTSGKDYFSKLDMMHFAFVTHGVDSEIPYTPGSYKLGPDPQKDVFVEFGVPKLAAPKLVSIDVNLSKGLFSRNLIVDVDFQNTSGEALYSLTPLLIIRDDKTRLPTIDTLLPFERDSRTHKMSIGLLGVDTPESIEVFINGQIHKVPVNRTSLILFDLLILSILLVGAVGLIYVATRKVLNRTHVKKKKNVAKETLNYKEKKKRTS